MSSTDRQNSLLVAQDWTRIYQTFRNADFKSYDFENLRRTMISYIRENYPEDFNDYIESSEYLALIDLVAFVGQGLAYRVDLNARDNFLELAERRESVLRIARLLSYNVKRNVCASGLLKFQTVSTTEEILDSNGRNLSQQTVVWNDSSNPNWYEQFIKIVNASMPTNQPFGKPRDFNVINGIATESYSLNSVLNDIPVFSFSKAIDGRNMTFEVTSCTFKNQEYIYEEPPNVGNPFGFLYRDDGQGTASSNTGFFAHFRQGTLNQGSFTVDQPTENEIVDLDATNINNDDVWLYKLDANGNNSELWTKVEAIEGNNIIYNSLNKNIRNIYNVITRSGDRISVAFADGIFGNLPKGSFRVYYRTSNGLAYSISPKNMKGVSIEIPYVSSIGQLETLTITLSLQSTVGNAATSETNESIKQRAPSTYYTQNRMITAEDYNVAPLAINQDILKLKAVNRTSSGISRYFDLLDPTGKYSNTNIFGDDGVLYRQFFEEQTAFTFISRTDIESVMSNVVEPLLAKDSLLNFYYSEYTRVNLTGQNFAWGQVTVDQNQCTGFVKSTTDPSPRRLGIYTSGNLKSVEPGSLIKFVAPTGKFFSKNNLILDIPTSGVLPTGGSTERWTKVISVNGDGTGGGDGRVNNIGTVVLNNIIPNDAILEEIIPKFSKVLLTAVKNQMIDLIFSNKTFGLRFDIDTKVWSIIFDTNLNIIDDFNLGKTGDVTNSQLDSSWLLLFDTDGETYTITARGLRYIFESDSSTRFYYDSGDKVFDSKTGQTIKDSITVFSTNNKPDNAFPLETDKIWEIVDEYRSVDGYVDTKKIQVGFFDGDEDGVVDDPDLFEKIVAPRTNPTEKYVVLKRYNLTGSLKEYRYDPSGLDAVLIKDTEDAIGSYANYQVGQYFYIRDTDVVKKLISVTQLAVSTEYQVVVGRSALKFQYKHAADYANRIDPSLSNIIDVYMLTKSYDLEYRRWLANAVTTKPLPPGVDELYIQFGQKLNNIKSISDEIVYNPAKYKPLFGSKADPALRATFKVVKNKDLVISDNEIKTAIVQAINQFFTIDNWDFGETFYFSELSSYVVQQLSPRIVNFVIVPKQTNQPFGGLFEILSNPDEIFVSSATVDDIEIVDNLTGTTILSDIEVANTVSSTPGVITSAPFTS